jgi:hypothetical protein
MKKTPFYYYFLILGLFITLIFSACKDEPHIEPPSDNVLKSKSFEVIDLHDSVAGNYSSYPKIGFGGGYSSSLKCSYIVRNITSDTIKYHIKLERLEANLEHYMQYCIGTACETPKVSDMPNPWTTAPFPNTFLPNGQTDAMNNSYIGMWSGAGAATTQPGLNKFRVTYSNAFNTSDYVTFVLTYNFYE